MTEVDPRTQATRRRLIDATIDTIREQGITHTSARTIAATGGVNQALVFYHFGSVNALIGEACLVNTRERVELLGPRFDAVRDFAGLVAVARELHASESASGNVTVLAQVLAGAQSNPELAAVVGQALSLWTDRVTEVLQRLLTATGFETILDARGFAGLVASAFIGIELLEPTGIVEAPDAALDRFAGLAGVIDGLGPLARRAVRSTLKP